MKISSRTAQAETHKFSTDIRKKKEIQNREEKSQEASNDQHKGKKERQMSQLEIFWHYHHKE